MSLSTLRSQGTKVQWMPKKVSSRIDEKSKTSSRGRCQERKQDIEPQTRTLPSCRLDSIPGDTGACLWISLDGEQEIAVPISWLPGGHHGWFPVWPHTSITIARLAGLFSLLLIITAKSTPCEAFRVHCILNARYPQCLAQSLKYNKPSINGLNKFCNECV